MREGVTDDFKNSIALSTFFIPTFEVLCNICLCRFDVSTTSPSTIPTVPTPAPAMYAAAGQPRPPAPTIRTLAALSRSWPVYLISKAPKKENGKGYTLDPNTRNNHLPSISLVLFRRKRPFALSHGTSITDF